jgi:PAS domain S-box-containing protein
MSGKTGADLFSAEQAAIYREHDRQVLEDGVPTLRQERLLSGDRRRTFAVLRYPLPGAGKRQRGVCSVSIEITGTEFEMAGAGTAELIEANRMLRAEIVQRIDGEHRLEQNGAAERVLGYTPAERAGINIAERVHPEDLPAIRAVLAEALEGHRESATVEYRYRHKDGSWRLLETTARNLLRNPAVRGIVLNTRDVTERRRSEDSLRRKERDLRDSQAQLRALAARLITSQEEEASRLARELHDDLNQKLAFLAVEAEMIERRLPESANAVREGMRSLARRAVEVSEDVRRIAQQLHPAVLDDLGLEPALRSHCAAFARMSGIAVRFSSRGVGQPPPPDVALCLYRVAQEALRNTAKHSGAPRASVMLTGGSGAIRLSISDPGSGFDPGDARGRGGLGITSMEERVRLAGGSIRVESQSGKGTRIRVHVPLPGVKP